MTKRTRTVLFFILLALFLVAGPSTVLYSWGYRLDFEKKKITQTGALYFKVWPKSAQIYLDGKLTKRTDFFFGATLIENLLPKKYEVEIKKEGFRSWKKTLQIAEKQVIDAKNVVLIPEKPNFTILTKEVEDFFFSPDGKKIILVEKNQDGWALKFFDLEKNLKIHLVKEKDISKTSEADFLDLEFSADSKEIFLKAGVKEKIEYFTLNLEKTPPILTPLEANSLRKPTQEELSLTAPENVLIHETLDGEIYYLDNSGYLFKSDSLFNPQLKINEKPLPIKEEVEYNLMGFKNYFFIQEGQILYLFNPDLKSFEKFFEPAKEMEVSPDFKKLVYFSDWEIWILFLEEKFDQPWKKAGEQLFLTRLAEKIDRVFWYTSHYLVFAAGDKIKIAEIDDRDRINIVDFAEFKSPRIFFNHNDKKLFILSEKNLYSSERLLP